jgi:TetR/AcrR family transcriptional repressor of nem operon
MRKSKQEAAKTRERIVKVAAEEIREHGIVATGLSDLMTAAGLTHGGFYRHFDSKDQLVTEAGAAAMANLTEKLAAATSCKPHRKGLPAVVKGYLSTAHRDNPRDGCLLAALGSELSRANPETREVATAGFLKLVEVIAGQFDQTDPNEAKKQAIVTASTMIGALTMSRVVNDQALSKSILRNAEKALTGP